MRIFKLILVIAIMIAIVVGLKVYEKNQDVQNVNNEVQNKEESNQEDDKAEDETNTNIDENIEQDDKTEQENIPEDDGIPKYLKSEKDIRIPILLYHHFVEANPPVDMYSIVSTPERFEEHLVGLIEAGYTFITVEELVRYNKNELALPEKVIVLTLDDGWLSNYTMAFPIFKKLNIKATIFVVDDLVGTNDYFTWEQAKEMIESGLIAIQTHGKSHIHYENQKNAKLVEDIEYAHGVIEEKLGKKVEKIFAYPYGTSTDAGRKALQELGYTQMLTTKAVNMSNNLNMSRLARIYIYHNYTVKQILNLIEK